MANNLSNLSALYWNRNYDSKVFSSATILGNKFVDLSIKEDPFEVRTTRSGNYCIISATNFFKEILMRDTFLDKIFGRSWESKVKLAQQKAFETAYIYWREQQEKNYQVERLK